MRPPIIGRMCGRYVHPDDAAIEREWHVGRGDGNPFGRRFNVAPTMTVPVLRADPRTGGLTLVGARWGLVPQWWKEASPPKLTINARAEEAAAKPMWRQAYRGARCLVPAEGWYEWRAMEHVDRATGEVRRFKQPFYIHRADARPFCFAGLMSAWRAPGADEETLSCALLTRSAAGPAAEVHDRMPVVLPEDAFAAWTDPQLTDAARVAALLAGRARTDFAFHPVSTRVNSARNEGPELVAPV